MKKLLLTSAMAATFTMAGGDIAPVTNMSISNSPSDSGWDLFPFLNDGYTPNLGIALIGGGMDLESSDENMKGFYGIELSLNCPLLKVPFGKIRQQVDITRFDHNGVEITEFNLNPHLMFPLNDTVAFGVGPSFGAANIDVGSEDDTVFSYGVGASVRSDLSEHLFIGAEARYTWTTDATLYGVNDNLNNLKVFAKIGYQF